MMEKRDAARNQVNVDLQSLMGYGRRIHAASGGICQYCDFGDDTLDVRHWLQLSVEHVIPAAWLDWRKIEPQLRDLFGDTVPDSEWPKKYRRHGSTCRGVALIDAIYLKACVTTCHFCNSATSWWDKHCDSGVRKEFDAIFHDDAVRCAPTYESKKDILLRNVEAVRERIYEEKRRLMTGKMAEATKFFESVRHELEQRRRNRICSS